MLTRVYTSPTELKIYNAQYLPGNGIYTPCSLSNILQFNFFPLYFYLLIYISYYLYIYLFIQFLIEQSIRFLPKFRKFGKFRKKILSQSIISHVFPIFSGQGASSQDKSISSLGKYLQRNKLWQIAPNYFNIQAVITSASLLYKRRHFIRIVFNSQFSRFLANFTHHITPHL